MKETAYERYSERVKKAKELGFKAHEILKEMRYEISSIKQRCIAKSATLSLNRTPYAARETVRAAHECITALERICNELKEETHVAAHIN